MTKRLLALATALILAVTMLNLSVFAATGSAKITDNGDNTVKIEWSYTANDSSSAVTYTYTLTDKTNSKTLASTTTKTTATSVDNIKITASGSLVLDVDVYVGGNYTTTLHADGSATYTASSTSGGITVTQDGSSAVTVTWTNDSYSSYALQYKTSASGSTNTVSNATSGTSIGVAYSSLYSVTLIGYSKTGNNGVSATVGTWYRSTSSGSTSGSVTTTGNVSVSGGTTYSSSYGAYYYTFSWTGSSSYKSYKVEYASSTAGSGSNTVSSTSYSAYLKAGATYYVQVTGYTGTSATGTGTVIGTAIVVVGTTGSSSGTGVTATRTSTSGTNSIYKLSWNAVTNASGYVIDVSSSNGGVSQTLYSNTNSYTGLTLATGYTYTITVTAYLSTGSTSTVGYTTFVAGSSSSSSSSTVTYTNNGIVSSNTYSYTFYWTNTSSTGYILYANGTPLATSTTNSATVYLTANTYYTITVYDASGNVIGSTTLTAGASSSSGSSSSSTTTSGTNCTVVSYASTKTVSWTAYSGASYYVVYYFVGSNSTGSQVTVYSTSTSIPVANTSACIIYVVPYDAYGNQLTGAWASATVAAASSSSSSSSGSSSSSTATTTMKNISISSSTTTTTTITWDKVSGTAYYYISYGILGTSAGSDDVTSANSFTLPYGKNASFEALVYAVSTSGNSTYVGYIQYVPGTSSSSDTGSSSSTASKYPTTFKATSGTSGKITLSWVAADDATSYTVYWKRSSNSTWNKATTTKKTAVNITGLKDGTSYDFYIVTDTGYSSGVATITPSTKTSTVIADDPVDSSSTVTSLKSVTSTSSGSITVSWTAVSGATSYKVYVAEGSSTTYKCKATVTSGTSTTITGLTSGTTYKVRVVAVPYSGTISTALKACSYMSVTVK